MDRKTALKVLLDISNRMYPNYDIFGNKILCISRFDFEEIRKQYLDKTKIKEGKWCGNVYKNKYYFINKK